MMRRTRLQVLAGVTAFCGLVSGGFGQADSSPFGFFFDGSDDEVDFSDGGDVDMIIPDLDPVPGAGTGPGAGNAAKGYQEPNFDKKIFDADNVGLDAAGKKALAKQLTAAAVNFPKDRTVTDVVKAKAIALAKRLDPSSATIFTANSMLKRGLTPRKVTGADFLSKRTVADGIWKTAVKLIDGSSDDSRKLGAYLVDVAATLDPDDPFKLERRGRLVQAGVGAKWAGVLGGAGGAGPSAGKTGDGKTPSVVAQKKLARKQAQVGMLYMKVQKDGTTIGQLGKVTVSAADVGGGDKLSMSVAGGTPKLRQSAPGAVGRLAAAHGNWPRGVKVTARLGSWYRAYEANSATVACAVGVDSIMRDWDVDPKVAVVGGVDAAGNVTAVRELANRLKTARDAGVEIVGVPMNDDGEVGDLCILNKLKPFVDVQVFGMETVDDAVALAPAKRAADLQKAIDLFAEFQEVMAGKDIKALVGNGSVQAKLREVGKLAPNHLSARYLLLAGMNRRPAKLSFQGSRDALTEVAVPIGQAAGYGITPDTVLTNSPAAVASQTIFDLKDLRPKLHKAALEYNDSLTRYAEAFKGYSQTTNPVSARARTLKKEMDDAMRTLKMEAAKFRRIDKARFAD